MSASFTNSPEPVIAPKPAAQDLAPVKSEAFCSLLAEAKPIALSSEMLLAAQAMRLLMRLDSELLKARVHWNQDWFRRLMHSRSKAVSRMKRRWAKIEPQPAIPLGALRRRFHANLARYLYQTRP